MARRKISYVDANKALTENRNRREQSRLEAAQKAISERENTRTLIENARDIRFKKERNHSMLMEAARDDNLSKALKAVYITALNPISLTEENLAYADGIVDKYINERGGATSILTGVKENTYFLSRLTQIVEDAARVDVHNIENFDRDLEKEYNMEKSDPIPNKDNDVHNMDPINKVDTSDRGPKEGSKHNPYDNNPIKDFDPMDKFTKTNESCFINEASLDDVFPTMSEGGKERKALAKKINAICGQVLLDNGVECSLSPLYIGGNNAAFIKGQSRTWLMGVQAKHHSVSVGFDSSGGISATTGSENNKADRTAVEKLLNLVKDNKDKLAREIEEQLGIEVDSVKVAHGKLGVTNLAVTLKYVPADDNGEYEEATEIFDFKLHPLEEYKLLYNTTGDDSYIDAIEEYYVNNVEEFVICEGVEDNDQVTINSDDGAEITITIRVNKGSSNDDAEPDDGAEVEEDLEDGNADIEENDENEDSSDEDLAEGDAAADGDNDQLSDSEDEDLDSEATDDGDVDDANNDGEQDQEEAPVDNGEEESEEPEEGEEEGSEPKETEFEDEESEEEVEEPGEGEETEEESEEEEDEVIGKDADGSNVDSDDTLENPGEEKGQLFKDLENEPDIKRAIEIIRDRISDAEETFIKNNAEDKAKITQLIDKISDNVKTVKDAGADSKEGKIAQESAACLDRYRKDIQQGRPVMSIFEKIVRKLNGSMLKNRQVLETYIDEETGKLDEALIIESARVLYGWIETVNTLQLEKVDENFIEDVIESIK